jgi:hypothetical protein
MNLDNYLQQTNKDNVKSWINGKLRKYLIDKPENMGEIEHIIDYFNSDKCPLDIKTIPYEQAVNMSKKWIDGLIKESNDIVETEVDTETILTFEKGFKFVKLLTKNAVLREGNLMSHCVGSYDPTKKDLYSLRDAKNISHCTIEVSRDNKTDRVNQVKGKGNGEVHPRYINYVIDILKYFKMEIRNSELNYIGYNNIDIEGAWEFLEDNFDGIKFLSFNGKKYLYNKSKLTRKLPSLPKE